MQINDPNTPAGHTSPGYVLVVDDEEFNRSLLKEPLEVHGYEVAEAENGEQALSEVARRPPDAILLDVMMPQMDGFEVCRRLKRNQATAPIPILMVTALSERKERLMGIEAGANDFLTKPVDLPDVILRVGNAVYTKRLFDQLQAEKEKSERLLLNILPSPIAERMKKGEANIANSYPAATVLYADLVNFTMVASHIGPAQMVEILNEIFSAFDLLVEAYGLEKIKTNGSAYLAAAPLAETTPTRVETVARLALGMQKAILRFNSQYHTSIPIRVGIGTGLAVAGVIGRKRFAYDLWGEAYDIASHLGSFGEPGSIQVDAATRQHLKHQFRLEPQTAMSVKGLGEIEVYRLVE